MEANLNCDLGEESIHYNGKNDKKLLTIVNTANIACGYHAGNPGVMRQTIVLAKKNNVSIGAHPGFEDKENFGRKRINLEKKVLKKLITDQVEILCKVAKEENCPVIHVKPHGALNNMACEDFELSLTIGQAIREFDKNLIYMVLPLTEMENAAKKLKIQYACEIFADRNYDDNGFLLSRHKKNAIISDPFLAYQNVAKMLNDNSIYSYSGKKIPCEIDSICIHGDNENAVNISKTIKSNLEKDGICFKQLNKIKKFK